MLPEQQSQLCFPSDAAFSGTLGELFSGLEFRLSPGFYPSGAVQDSSQIQDGRLSGDVQKLTVNCKPAVSVFLFRLPSVEGDW